METTNLIDTAFQVELETTSVKYFYKVEIWRDSFDGGPEEFYDEEIEVNDVSRIAPEEHAESALNWWIESRERCIEINDVEETWSDDTTLVRLFEDIAGYGVVPDSEVEEGALTAYVKCEGFQVEQVFKPVNR